MIVNDDNVDLANELRDQIHSRTATMSDGEGVAMVLLWGFLTDHAGCEGIDIEELARSQLEAFIEYARENIAYVQQH
jgi:hypothetical protein